MPQPKLSAFLILAAAPAIVTALLWGGHAGDNAG